MVAEPGGGGGGGTSVGGTSNVAPAKESKAAMLKKGRHSDTMSLLPNS